MFFNRKPKFTITVETSDHKRTRGRTTSVTVDKDVHTYRISAPGTSEELRVTIKREK